MVLSCVESMDKSAALMQPVCKLVNKEVKLLSCLWGEVAGLVGLDIVLEEERRLKGTPLTS
jgi:hypothetical protein